MKHAGNMVGGPGALLRRGIPLSLGLFALHGGADSAVPDITVRDLAPVSGFQDYWDNHYRRGRSVVADDFDGDGRVDFFIGNPGDESFIFRNSGPGRDGVPRFEVAQILLQGDLAFVASGSDYDNDGDLDLFVGCGGLEGLCFDFLFRNDSAPGRISFTDVSEGAGIRGPPEPGGEGGVPLAHATGGGTWGDYDRDGDPDLFVSVRDVASQSITYRSILWNNSGDGTFLDVTMRTGLEYWSYTRHDGGGIDWTQFQNSTWIDADNDGDLDLFLNNALGPNVLWKNLLAEQGSASFVEATAAFSLPGEDLRFPRSSFASAVADFNNDGWQDLILFAVGGEPPISPYGNGNGLFLNLAGRGFYNAAARARINMPNGEFEVAMGSQVADLNADGIPDLAIGAGSMGAGRPSRLLLSTGMDGEVPVFADADVLIDFEPPHGIDPSSPPYPEIPPYPYRTHGMAAADIDADGSLELAVLNGGPAAFPPIVREPNRLFKFTGGGLGRTFRLQLRGNGAGDGRDAIGARAYVEVDDSAGRHRVFQTVLGGSGFSSQNERTLTFGLGNDGAVSRAAVLWPSGCLQLVNAPGGGAGTSLTLEEDCWNCPAAPDPVAGWLDPDAYGCAEPPPCRVEGVIRDALGPVPWTRLLHDFGDPSGAWVDARSDAGGVFAVQHPAEPDTCRTTVLEPFGYLPLHDPILTEGEPGVQKVDVVLERAPERQSPRGAGYWQHETRALLSIRGRAHETASEMTAWREAILARYPGLGFFETLPALSVTLQAGSSRTPGDRVRRHMAATLLNLASGRLTSFTGLATGETVGDLAEKGYLAVLTRQTDPAELRSLAGRLERLNEGLLFIGAMPRDSVVPRAVTSP